MNLSDYPKAVKRLDTHDENWLLLPMSELYKIFDKEGVNVCVIPIFAQKRFLEFGAAVYWCDDVMLMSYFAGNHSEGWLTFDYTDEQPTKFDFFAFDNREEAEKKAWEKGFSVLESILNQKQ